MKKTILMLTAALGVMALLGDDKPFGEAYRKQWNKQVNDEIDARIEKYRKADAVVCGFRPGADVKVEQVESEFQFGINLFNFDQLSDDAQNAQYRKTFIGPDRLFNAATIPFYWANMEPVQGQIRYTRSANETPAFWRKFHARRVAEKRTVIKSSDNDCPVEWRRPSPDQLIEFCEANQIAMHGHVILYPPYHPKWVRDMTDKDEVGKIFDRRVYDIATYYKGRIPQWDIVNESVNRACTKDSPNDDICWNNKKLTVPWDYTYKAHRLAEKLFPPSVQFVINDSWRDIYPPFVKDLMRRGAKIDIVGLQMHIFLDKHALEIACGKARVTNGTLWTPQAQISYLKQLDDCGNRPIHLSEVTIPAPREFLPREEAEQVQARMMRDNYRLWFSWPSIYRITYWNLVDSVGGEILYSGFYNRDLSKKPAYHALDQLINKEWRTNLSLKANDKGEISFRGFKGTYRVTGTDAQGASYARTIVVK